MAAEARGGKKGKSTLLISDVPILKSKKTKPLMRKPLSLLSALLLTACVATPPTTPQVTEVKQDKLGLEGAAAPQVRADWWKAFADPQADRLAAAVVANNPTLAGALGPHARGPGAACRQPGRRPAAGHSGRQRTAHSVQQGLHHSAALWRHLALVRLADHEPQLESGFLGQAGGADRPGARQAPRPRRWMPMPRGWRCRALSPRPISICCSTISMATSPTPRCASAKRS